MAEITVQTQVNHQNLVRVIDVIEGSVDLNGRRIIPGPGKLLMVMEYCEGGNLRNWLNQTVAVQQQLDEAKALKLMLNVAQGIAMLHSRDPVIVHRDLKPENIFLTAGQSDAKVGDFGVAKELSRVIPNSGGQEYTYGENVGTLAYIAPEVFGSREYTVGCDAYAFGVILYELFVLRGRCKVFRAEEMADEQSFKNRVANGTLSVKVEGNVTDHLSSSIKQSLTRLINKCLLKHHLLRPRFHTIVQDLQGLLRDLQSPASVVSSVSSASASSASSASAASSASSVAIAAAPLSFSSSRATSEDSGLVFLDAKDFPSEVIRVGAGAYGEVFRCDYAGTAVVLKQVHLLCYVLNDFAEQT